jgi:hypothetical protein
MTLHLIFHSHYVWYNDTFTAYLIDTQNTIRHKLVGEGVFRGNDHAFAERFLTNFKVWSQILIRLHYIITCHYYLLLVNTMPCAQMVQ